VTAIGHYSLFIAHALALWGVIAAAAAYLSQDKRYLDSALTTLYALTGFVLLAVGVLLTALVRDDFTVQYVWEYSRRSQPLIYKMTALWGGMSGSLLFWAALLAIFSSLAVTMNRRGNLKILPFACLILLVTLGFFLFLLTFKTSPFDALKDPETGRVLANASLVDGRGLNPLLQNFFMAVHPPTLYFGFVGFTIPFAFILAALAHRERNTFWMRSARNWAMFSWLTLGMGNILGAYWAYIELGWGGYWAWDPVENASFMPWLVGTAFLHSFLMQEKRGIYRVWNVFFIVSTFLLCVYGTYLTRSGVLQSVHAFGQEDPSVPWYLQLGNIFLAFLALMLLTSIGMTWARRGLLRSGQQYESAASRESMFLYGNLLFTLFTFVVFFGVTYPIFYRMFTGKELHHGPEYYNARIIPVALMLVLVMGISSMAPWKRGGFASYRKQILFPALFGLASTALAAALMAAKGFLTARAFGERPLAMIYVLLCVAFTTFTSGVVLEEYARMAAHALKHHGTGPLRSLLEPFRENPRRYGGYIVHLGMAMMCIGIAFSSTFQTQYQMSMKAGDEARFGPFDVRLRNLSHDDLDADLTKVNETRIWADLEVFEEGKLVSRLRPMRVYYASNPEQPSYEVALHTTFTKDFYAVLAGFDLKDGSAVLTTFVNPLLAWIWIGGLLLLVGGCVALVPMRRR
jgi:cytochrome c-type biogenesis protein CcmF